MPQKFFLVKKGPADPFRGDWYIEEKAFNDFNEAIAYAAKLTINNFNEFKKDWDEFGYEWSVFEKKESTETKLWEGYKYISLVRKGEKNIDGGKV